ncbi:MAG: hypothetical protein R2824_26430 [Saprospiraceae bacterium]
MCIFSKEAIARETIIASGYKCPMKYDNGDIASVNAENVGIWTLQR